MGTEGVASRRRRGKHKSRIAKGDRRCYINVYRNRKSDILLGGFFCFHLRLLTYCPEDHVPAAGEGRCSGPRRPDSPVQKVGHEASPHRLDWVVVPPGPAGARRPSQALNKWSSGPFSNTQSGLVIGQARPQRAAPVANLFLWGLGSQRKTSYLSTELLEEWGPKGPHLRPSPLGPHCGPDPHRVDFYVGPKIVPEGNFIKPDALLTNIHSRARQIC